MDHDTKLAGFPLKRKGGSAGKMGGQSAAVIGLIAALLLMINPAARAEEPAPILRTDWQIMCEPTLVRPAFAEALAGSPDISITPALYEDWSWKQLPAEDFSALEVALPDYIGQALRNLIPLLDEVEVEYYRDPNQVIEYAVLRTDGDPRLGALILLPEFHRKFEPIFGPNFLAVLPNTNHIFLFPRLASNLDQHAAMLLQQYERVEGFSVGLSKDIFVISESGPAVAARLLDPRTDPVELFTKKENPDAEPGLDATPADETLEVPIIDTISKLRP